MKKTMLPFKVVVLLLLLQSCRKFDEGSKIVTNCSWNRTEQVVFYNLQLKYPAGLSSYHTALLSYDKIDRSFNDVILRNSDIGLTGNTGNIRVNVKSDGTKCIGEKTTSYDKTNYNDGLYGSLVKSPFPDNAAFVGEITVTLKSNVYNNTSGNGAYYHILWEQTGNNANGGMAGTMTGTKITYNIISGTNRRSIGREKENSYYYSGGDRIQL